jgi:hypothetical protein
MEAGNSPVQAAKAKGPRQPLHPQPKGDHLSDRRKLELALPT